MHSAPAMRVSVLSPFRNDVGEEHRRNVEYARQVCRFLALRGFAPHAPHLHDPQFLDDGLAEEREIGIANGMAAIQGCAVASFWYDRGLSDGMRAEMAFVERIDKRYCMCSLDKPELSVERILGDEIQ